MRESKKRKNQGSRRNAAALKEAIRKEVGREKNERWKGAER